MDANATTQTRRAWRFALVRQELDAIASCELSDVLAAMSSGQDLSPAQRARLAAYLRDELGSAGMLSVRHLVQATDDREFATRLNAQATRLLRAVTS